MKELIKDIKINEGFRGMPYDDTLGFATIGYGTKLPLSREESEILLKLRLENKIIEIEKKEPFIKELPLSVQNIILDMTYQMGVNGVLKFKNMWRHLKDFDYVRASEEMLDSRWAVQTPNRAKKLADVMKRSV